MFRIKVLAFAGVAAVVAIFGVALPAQAITGSTLVTTASVSSSVSKDATAVCPAGTNVFGGGAKIVYDSGGAGDVFISDIEPDAALQSVRAQGAVNGGVTASLWRVMAYAICAPPVSNLQLVAADSLDNGTSRSPRIATAICPAGLSTYGLGFRLDDASGEVFIDSAVPNSGLTQTTVGAYEDGTYNPNWDLRAFAICGDPVANMSLQYASSGLSVAPTHDATTADCPTGTTLTGVGGYLIGSSGDNMMDQVTPNPSLRAATARGRENTPIALGWAQDTYGICAGV